MGGWADGINAKMIGIPDPAMVWVGYRDRDDVITTTLSLQECPDEGGGQQVWVEMDIEAWKRLRKEIDVAIETLEGRQ